MCGITGIFGKSHLNFINILNDTLNHRGPDDSGVHSIKDKNVSFAMKRLSIIDLENGHQPMIDTENDNIIVFNGEIFNALELRNELSNENVNFSSKNSDTEVLLKLYAKYGTEMLKLLNGMFAFAIYDSKKDYIFIARDRAGIKPLYYSNKNEHFIFASELKSLVKIPFISNDVDFYSIKNYLTYQFVPSPKTIYTDIKKLDSSHFLIFNLKEKSIKIHKYWQPSFKNSSRIIDREDLCKKLRGQIEESINKWSTSDVPIGISLSGGLDSSIITALLHQNNTNLATWSLGFEDKNLESIDERNLASLVAKKYKTDHTEISINSKSILNELSDMAYSLDEPYGGGLPSWFIYKEMSKQMKVCMTGTGGDELFGNYKKWAPYRDPKVGIRTILKSIKANGIKNLMKYPKGGVYPTYMGELETNSILLNELHNYNSISLIDYKWSQSNVSNAIDGIAYTDFYFQLTDEFLHMTDRFSMNFSMEARTPFLDHELIDFVFSIDYRDRIYPNNLKKLLIDSTSDLIPDEVINSSKRGFIIPHDVWLKNDLYSLAKKYFSKEFLRRQNIFSKKLINNLIDPYFNGNSLLADKVWTIFMFQFWWDTFQLRG